MLVSSFYRLFGRELTYCPTLDTVLILLLKLRKNAIHLHIPTGNYTRTVFSFQAPLNLNKNSKFIFHSNSLSFSMSHKAFMFLLK